MSNVCKELGDLPRITRETHGSVSISSSHFCVLSFTIKIHTFVFSSVLLYNFKIHWKQRYTIDVENGNKSLGVFCASVKICADGRQSLFLWGTEQ